MKKKIIIIIEIQISFIIKIKIEYFYISISILNHGNEEEIYIILHKKFKIVNGINFEIQIFNCNLSFHINFKILNNTNQ